MNASPFDLSHKLAMRNGGERLSRFQPAPTTMLAEAGIAYREQTGGLIKAVPVLFVIWAEEWTL